MRAFALLRLTAPFGAIALSACAPRQFPTIPTPEPAPPALTEPPIDWHLRDAEADRVPGISLLKAERELLAGKQPRRVVVVAIIDGGVDTAHADLRSQMWANPRETPGNGRDDDGNGFADDVRGWNLIGGKDGRNVNEDTFEVTRLAAQCGRPAGGGRDSLPADLRARCADIEAAYQKKRVEVEGTLQSITNIEQLYLQILPYLRRAAGIGVGDTLTLAQVRAIAPANDTVRQSKNLFLQLAAQDLTQEEVADARKAYTSQAQYGYNKTFDPRPIVGDSYPDTTIKRYGNADVTGPDATHGTHVAGIVAALKNANDATGGGIAQNVRIMALRAVPDGDERDKDIALAIRYAADNGAHIINMSFGKSYSPHKKFVDEAVKYADAKGVLMVHAAGNDGANSAEKPSFPTPFYIEGGRARNWIEVGATSWHAKDSLVATFSNYGKPTVDVFAPGDDIQSTIPGGGFKKQSGTSMASPVVAGLAALLMSYYPAFTAEDVKRIILESSTKLGDQMVYRPGDATGGPAPVRFGDLSATGGIVNAYNAIKMAEQLSGARP